MTSTCTIPGCERKTAARGLCHTHWALWKKRGDPLAPRLSAPYWTPEEDRKLYDLIRDTPGGIGRAAQGEVAELAVHLERSVSACRTRLSYLRWRRRTELGL